MEQNLVKKQTVSLAFVENATQSIENMLKYAEVLLQSGLCPLHFYEKGADNKPDLKKGKPAAVVMVLQHGMEIGLSPMQSLQQVIPVNGLISIKGDGAKSLIFRSGLLEPNSWKEEESGSINNEDYTFSITAQRKDNGLRMTSTFSVAHAKRAGLWIDKSKIQGQDGWKYKLSAWWKYPLRMIKYRALGFLARDLFGDVLQGMYTSEEAADLPQDQTTIIPLESGANIIIPDKDFNKERSQNLTNKATEKIDKVNNKQELSENEKPENGKKRGRPPKKEEPVKTEENKAPDEIPMESVGDDEIPEVPEITGTSDIPINEYFENKETPQDEVKADVNETGNQFGIVIPDFDEGLDYRKTGDPMYNLYHDLKNIAKVDNSTFEDIKKNKLPNLQKYRDREEFCTKATVQEINDLLNIV